MADNSAIRRPPQSARPVMERFHGGFWGISFAAAMIMGGIAALFDFPLVSSTLAFTLIAICFFPTYEYIKRDVRDVPAIPLLTGAFAVQLAVPVFTGDHVLPVAHSLAEISEDMIVSALLLANVAAAIIVWICTSTVTRRASKVLPTLHLQLNRKRAIAFCAIFGALAVAATVLRGGGEAAEYGAFARVIRNQTLVIIVILAWLRYDSDAVWAKVVWYAAMVVAVIVGMSTLFIEAVIAPIAVMFLCAWLYTRRISKRLVGAVIVAVFFLNPGKTEVRQKVWQDEVNTTTVQRAALWIESAAMYWADALRGQTEMSEGAKAVAMRANHVYLLARVVERTPDPTPYLYGTTYAFFLYSAIPRFVWPDKPVAEANRLLAVRYQLTTEESAEKSTFGIGLLGEGYANFGLMGIILIASILGAVLLIMMRLFGAAEAGPGGAAIMMSFFVYFLNGMGTSAEILLGNLFQSMLASYFLLYWASERASLPKRARAQKGAR